MWLEAKEIAFTQGAFAQEQSSLVLDTTDAPKKNKRLGAMQQRCLDALAKLIGTEYQETNDDMTGIPVDVFFTEVGKLKGKELSHEETQRITHSYANADTGFLIIDKGLVNERW